MENLIMENRAHSISRKIVSGFWILYAVVILISAQDSPDSHDWTRSLVFILLGIFFFTPLMGSAKVQIEIFEGHLQTLWINRLRKITIRETEIESIILAKNGILIKRKEKKEVKLLLYALSKEQRTKVYDLFTGYAHQKNFILDK